MSDLELRSHPAAEIPRATTMRSSHVVLLSAAAGAVDGAKREQAIRELFELRNVHANIRTLAHDEDVVSAGRRAVAENPEVVVAGGGDGTLNAIAQSVVGSSVTFGVLPLGTLHHFAKDMGIPLDLPSAVGVICDGNVKRVDVGRVNGRVFLNNSSLGLYPQLVRRRDQLTHRLGRGKWPAALWAALTVLRRHPFVQVRLTVDGKSFERRTPLVFIANNSYELDGLHLGARRCLDAGHLAIHIINRPDRFGLITLAVRALFGALRQANDFETFCALRVEVQTRRKNVLVATDGEVSLLDSPLIFEVEPLALPVLVPLG